MASYGFSSDHVNLIANNLRDRYKTGFPILKELIQNADDAKAKRLVFGLHPGFKDQVSHLLLQGPGLWVFNDGEFKPGDERAIRSFSVNSKAGDSGSIGKFGLGMKSVFHLCEAFFYVAFDGENDVNVLLNPWSDPSDSDEFHGGWGEVVPEEFDAIRTVVTAELSKGCSSWFLLWIPLRQDAHVPHEDGKSSGAIVDKYPGDPNSIDLKFLADARLGRKIRSIVPLLRNLETIELVGSQQQGHEFDGFKIQIAVDKTSCRVDHISPDILSTGAVVGGVGGRGKLQFRIQQKTMVGAEPFDKFKQLNAWPKTGSLNKLGKRVAVPDKSHAEGAVMVSGAPADGERAILDIHWAVFLPTEEGLSYEFPLETSLQSYRIVLHGQFFVDAGRRGIAGSAHLGDQQIPPSPDIDDSDLHNGWNQAVAQQVVLPMLLPALAQYAAAHLNPSETEDLARAVLSARSASTSAIGNGKGFWETFKNHICDGQAWVRIITPDGLKWSHEKIKSETRLLKLPPPPRHDIGRPWEVLPRLKKLSDDGCILLDEEAPSLLLNPSNWNVETLLDVLNGVDQDEACTETGMVYLEKFLSMEQLRYVNGSEVQGALITLLRKMLRREPLQVFRRVRSEFKKLVSLVNADYRFAVGTKKSGAITNLDDSTLKLLIDVDIQKLLLPMDLDPDVNAESKGKPDEDETRSILKAIDQEISRYCDCGTADSTQQIEVLLRAAQMVLSLLPEKGDERAKAIRVNRSFRILSATCARTNKAQAVSFDDLRRAHERGLVFKEGFGSGTSAYSTAAAFGELVPSDSIWVISGEVAKWIDSGEGQSTSGIPLATDTDAVYASLGKQGRGLSLTTDMRMRGQFIRDNGPTLIKGDDLKRGIRYVLHGSTAHHGDIDAPLWINADRGDAVWVKLKRMVEPEFWNLVDTQLAGAIKADDWETLNIRKIGPEQVLDYMRGDCNLDLIDATQFSAHEVSVILKCIVDDDLWKATPLHRDSKGGLGCITQNCYIDPDKLAVLSLADGCRIFPLSDDAELCRRQRELISHWSHTTTIERALAQATPVDHCQLILDTICHADAKQLGNIKALRSTSWLPLKQADAHIRPEDVIDLDTLADEIDRLAAANDYCYAGILALSGDVTAHKNYAKLSPLFASGTSALARLGLLMVEADGYLVGEFTLPEEEKLKDYLEPLAKLSSLPGWRIAKMACADMRDEDVADVEKHLLKELAKPLSITKLKEVLQEIPNLGKNKKLTSIFNMYLKQLAAFGAEAKAVVASLRLMASNGTWQDADHLCIGVEGADQARVLDEVQANILDGIVCRGITGDAVDADDTFAPSNTTNHSKVLENYFKPWLEVMPSPPIGGLFALLGPGSLELARDWLNPHTTENFADQITWNDPCTRDNKVWDYKKSGGYPKSEALGMLDFIPVISDAKEIAVRSLLDTPMSVDRSSDYDSLIVGKITWAGTRTGRHAFTLPLRMVSNSDLGRYDKAYLSGLLRKTCACILREAYNQHDIGLEIWASLEKSDQLELEVARELILESLPYDLRSIKVTKQNPTLKEALDKLKNLEVDRAGKKSNKQSITEVERSIVAAKVALAELMRSDCSVQATVLKGIRDKVKDNQYSVSSIAFELLQNADDAVMELQTLMHSDAAAKYSQQAIGRFVAESQGDTVRFVHWGRPINFRGHGAGRHEAHGEDLQRMLVLAASDKEDALGLTGKFGLGFKSVHLATDMPCLVSGDLKVKILGGCLPELWTEAAGALKTLQDHRLTDAGGPRGTVIEFSVAAPAKREDLLNRFAALAGLQCVFSKEIRTIEINGQRHCWSPKRLVTGVPCAEVGSVQLPAKAGSSDSRLLNLRLERACLAFRIDSRGCATFNIENEFTPPGVWVTAPTGEAAAKGAILSGPFTLDTGRGGLPHGESAAGNLKLAETFGREAAVQVRQLVVATRAEWVVAQECLGLNKGVTAAEFWCSFLDCILMAKNSADGSESERLLGRLGFSFYEKYLASSEEIPNGLPGEMSAFVQLTVLSLSLNQRWVKHVERLTNFAAFVKKYPPAGWISEAVANQQRTVGGGKEKSMPAVSVSLLLDCVPQGRCSPKAAVALAELLTDLTPDEQATCSAKLKGFYFQALDGSWQQGMRLLKSGCPQDAPCITFAPVSSLIDVAYEGAGLSLIMQYALCEPFQPDVVARWVLDARSNDARVSALRFLLNCDQGVKSQVRMQIAGTWLHNILGDSPYLRGFIVTEVNQLLGMFATKLMWEFAAIFEIENQPQLLQGNEALIAIHEWWQTEGEQHLKGFDRDFWPDGVPRNFSDESDSRAAWMTLFAIGLMQRYGRARDDQNRGYINHMQTKGWWDIFSNIDPHEDGQVWLNVLNEYGELQDDDEKFSMWMDSFPRLYRIARWFDNYRHVFESLDHRSRTEATSITSPNVDAVLTGSGIYAPSLVRGLKLGQHVVVRELLRFGVLSSETAKSHAFKPGSGVKLLLSKIGVLDLGGKDVGSQQIYDALYECLGDGASFNGAYDIPLQIMALDPSLQQRVLGAIAINGGESDEY